VRSHRRAAELLAESDPVLAELLRRAGPPVIARPTDSHFQTLVRAITHQQLAGAAARTIHGRLVAALDGEVTPERMLSLDAATMRAAGLSANKTASLVDLAAKVLDGTVVLEPKGLARESDEEVITRLCSVRGIGRWTAEMFLIFNLARPNVLPLDDLGLIRAISVNYFSGEPVTRSEAREVAANWEPWRTVATWYMWRSLEPLQG
jgi:DNA-3-methyladenine glycosylase II